MIATVVGAVVLPVILGLALVWFVFFSRATGLVRAGACVCLALLFWVTVPDSLATTTQQTNGGPYADSDPPLE